MYASAIANPLASEEDAMSAMELAGQRVLVVGGSGQMGSTIAVRAAELGATVVLVGRDRAALEAVSAKIPGASVLVGDAASAADASRLYAANGKVEHLVVAVSAGPVQASSIPATATEDAQAAYAKVWASYAALHHAPGLVTERGSVTLISGSSARRPGTGFGVWTGVHGAIEALAHAAVLELAPIRVNVVSPGGIGLKPDRQLVHRRGSADDIARAVLALITNPAVTGATFDVDSGERLGTWSGEPAT